MSSYDRIWDLKATCLHTTADNEKLIANRFSKCHGGWVSLVAISNDGSLVATGDGVGSVYLWDGNTGEFRTEVFERHPTYRGSTSLSFSYDKRRLISTFGDSQIFISDIFTAETQVLLGHEDWVKCTALSQDGRLLVSGSDDRTVRVWDVVNEDGDSFNMEEQDLDKKILRGEDIVDVRGKEQKDKSLAKLEGHDDSVLCVVVSHDARCIASGGDDTTIQLWYVSHESGVTRLTNSQCLTGHEARVVSVAFLSNGVEVISSSEDHNLH